jgi:hypothetical protein
MTDRDHIITDILRAPERAAKALERIDMDLLSDKDLKALQRRVMLFVGAMQKLADEMEQQVTLFMGAMQELAAEMEQQEQRLEVAD